MKDTNLIVKNCPNFRWYEVWKSSTADRMDIYNVTDDPVIITNVQGLVINLLQPLRNEVGPMMPQSWFRIEALEKALTQKAFRSWCAKKEIRVDHQSWSDYFKKKSHPKGSAIDIEVSSMSNDDLFELVKKDFEFDQLIREFPKKGIPDSGWVHISWASKKDNRGQVFTIP